MTPRSKRPRGKKAILPEDSRSYLLPALDTAFLMSDSMRGCGSCSNTRRRRKFSATGACGRPSWCSVRRARANGPARQRHWYAEARKFGRIASERGGAKDHNGGKRDNVIATGGGPGLMEAANRGAREAGAPTIGFNIRLPHEQRPNRYTTPALTFQFHYFAMRKMHFAMRANALVVFPGGFGTMDELFELLTLSQTRKTRPIPIVLFDEAYWREIINFDAMAAAGTIVRSELKLFSFADSAEDAWAALVRRGLKRGKTAIREL